MEFVHLHNHTHFSLLDGLSRPADCVAIAKKQGSRAVAITDHGVLYGVIEFYKAAKEQGINPIIGCEIYVAPAGRFQKEPGTPINHLTLLAATTEGYQNLIQLVTKANLEGFYYKPRVDHGLLKAYGRGLIALSGCLASETSEAILNGQEDRAAEIIKRYQEIFGTENFFLEVQDHREMPDQIVVNQALYRLGKATGAPIVATNDNHYARAEDRDVHDILLCIQTGKKVSDKDRMNYKGDFSLRSPEDIAKAFADHPEAIANTVEIADRCNVEISFGKNLLPRFIPPENVSPQEYLKRLCALGLRERFEKVTPEIQARLDYELQTIHASGFDTYFLIVHDFVKFAKEKGVIVGPGRGSAAGSLVSYCLKITDVDPLKYGLLFERFLNPERVSMPDIDIDFDDERRNEVLDYVVNKYGRENVAQIITFGTMAARAAVRDTGRAMGYPYGEVDRLAKLVPPPIQGRHTPLATSIQEDPGLRKAYGQDLRAKQLFDNAIRLEGTVRHAGTHACAVVIAEEPLSTFTPLQYATGDDTTVITQYSMKPLEELGLLKVDFLGLKNLTIMKTALGTIERLYGTHIDLEKIPLDDKKTFSLLARGETTGVFQLESAGMRRYLKELKPTSLHDIIAMVSLYRPGPMPWIPMYIRGKHERESVTYAHASFEPILKETYGVAVYQEQILEIARMFSGFTLGEADILRKAVGKKDPKLLVGEREKFIQGAVQKGHSRKFAENVFEKVIEPFAAYGFNKSHGTCYALIAYQTAYLKANYPAAFMAALLTADSANEDRVVIEVNECEAMGISVLPPSVNESRAHFTVVDDTTIRFGLTAIKGIGQQPIRAIIEAREKGGRFTGLADFFKRVPRDYINKKLLESLAYSGAFDVLGERKAIASSTEEIVKYARSMQTAASDGQTDIFGVMEEAEHAGESAETFHLKKVVPATRLEKLQWEKQFLGLFVSGHPLQGLKKYLSKKAHPIDSLYRLSEKELGAIFKVAGLIIKVKKVLTKNGAYMAYASIEDLTGRLELVIFPKTFQEFGALTAEGQLVLVEGRVEKRRDSVQCIVQSMKEISLDSMVKNAKEERLFDEKEKYVRVITKAPEEHAEHGSPAETSPFVISLSEKMDETSLAYLKKLLMANKGDRKVIITIDAGKQKQQIAVPFGVEVSDELRRQIAEVTR